MQYPTSSNQEDLDGENDPTTPNQTKPNQNQNQTKLEQTEKAEEA